MSDLSKAVFLSYASQDAEAAKRICEALRAAGVEVWFDQSELVGGDQWDGKIRGQIGSCALFVPLISANTQARLEGYFRLEWKLAAQRTHTMADEKTFLLPVLIDGTRDAEAKVPAEFKAVQWTKLLGGETPPAFCERVKKLLDGGVGPSSRETGSGMASRELGPPRKGMAAKWWWALPIFGVTMAIALLLRDGRHEAPPVPPAESSASRTIARIKAVLHKIDVSRVELDLAVEQLALAAKTDPANARVFATWALVDCRYLTEYYDSSATRHDAAARHAAQATSLDSSDPEVRLVRSITMRTLNHDAATRAEGNTLLESVRQDLPNDPRIYEQLGWWANDVATADAWWDRQAKLPGEGPVVALQRALRRTFEKDLRGGYAGLTAALAQEKSNKALLWKAYLEIVWLGDPRAAQRTIAQVPAEALVEDMPASARAFVAFWSGDYEQALAAIRAVPRDFMQSGAGMIPTGTMRGQALYRLGRVAAAENEWRTALAATERRLAEERDDWNLLMNKALLLALLGKKTEAADIWRTARELHGDQQGLWLEDDVAAQLLSPDKAIERLEGCVRGHLGWFTAAVLRLSPNYDHLRNDPRFIALQAEADADPRLSPAARVPLASPGAQTLDPGPSSPPPVDSKSVAVLAFANLSDDKGNEYFSDGISEELLNVLAKVPGLKVSARTSAFYFKGKEVPIPEIAKQLGVAYVVEGSVRKAGDKVRITAQLIKAADGFHVWSDTFTRDLKDIFAVQDEIAGLIAQQLSLKIGVRSAAATATINPEAFELYVQARRAWNLRNAAGFAQAEELLTRALMLEPDFARAHVALADVWIIRAIENGVILTFGQRAAPIFAQITSEIQKALSLDPDSSEARASWGLIVRFQQWNLPEAEREFRRAVELNPNYATAHHWLGNCLFESGRIDEGLAELRRAAELDPFSRRILEDYAKGLVHAGRPAEALAVLGRAETLQAKAPLTLLTKAEALLQLGRRTEAIATARELEYADRAELLAIAGEKAEAEAALGEAEGWSRYQLLTALGRTVEALATLRAEDVPITKVGSWLMDPRFDPFRSDPHFVELLTTLGLTESHARMQAWRKVHAPEKAAGK